MALFTAWSGSLLLGWVLRQHLAFVGYLQVTGDTEIPRPLGTGVLGPVQYWEL